MPFPVFFDINGSLFPDCVYEAFFAKEHKFEENAKNIEMEKMVILESLNNTNRILALVSQIKSIFCKQSNHQHCLQITNNKEINKV